MQKFIYFLIPLFMSMLISSCGVKDKATIVEETEEDVPDILLGAEMSEDHQEIETVACMECHTIKVDATSTATQRFLEREGAMEKDELWKAIVEFFREKQSVVLATTINNEPYVTTIDFALDPVKKVFYGLSEKGTRKLDQMKMNPKVALEYHQPREEDSRLFRCPKTTTDSEISLKDCEELGAKVFRCLQMRGEARVFSADDPQFDEGLKVFKPGIDPEMIKRGMDMTCFTPKEILFYDFLRKDRGLNIFQNWER